MELTTYRSFTSIYDTHKHAIFSYLYYRLAKDRERAEDLTGDTFYKALRSFDPAMPEAKVRPWLFVIARNTLTDSYRTHKTTAELDPDTLFDDTDLIDLLDTALDADRVRTLIAKLTPQQQLCITEYFLHDATTEAIAARHDLSRESVRQHISRGTRALRSLMTLVLLILFNTRL